MSEKALEAMARAGRVADLVMDALKVLRGLAADAPDAAAEVACAIADAACEAAGMPSPFATDAALDVERDVIERAKEWAAADAGHKPSEDALLDALDVLKTAENAG